MENRMLTQNIVREIADKLQCYNKDVRDVIDCLAMVVAEHVLDGGTVHISRLGTFYPCRSRSPKPEAGLVIKFRAASKTQLRG